MIPWRMVSQSIPKMTSRFVEGNRVRSALKIRPSMVRLTPLQMWVHFRSPKGELVMIGFPVGLPAGHAVVQIWMICKNKLLQSQIELMQYCH